MVDNTNKQAVIDAIWANPERVFGCQFRQSGKYQENLRGGEYDEKGKIRLTKNATGTNINVFYNGGSRPEKTDVFTYLQDYVLNTAGFKATLIAAAERCGVTLEFSEEQRKEMTRAALARELTASFVEALRTNPEGDAARYLRDTRGMAPDQHFGELSAQSIKAAKESLRRRGYKFSEYEFDRLFLTDEQIKEQHKTAEDYAKSGYNLIIPSYHDGVVRGFILRNARKDYTGKYKYLYGSGVNKSGYCDRLTNGGRAVVVEGQMDAIRLIQAGVPNVVAMGGASISDELAELLRSRNITEVVYIPDLEFDLNRQKENRLIQKAIKAFQAAKVDGVPVIKNLYVAEIPTPEDITKYPKYKDGQLCGYKIDADTYGKEYGGKIWEMLEFPDTAWNWEIDALTAWVEANDADRKPSNVAYVQETMNDIYTRTASPYERERIKDKIQIGGNKALFEAYGITPDALGNVDEIEKSNDYNDQLKALQDELNKAVANGANRAVVAEIVARLGNLQNTDRRADWDRQLKETFADELDTIKNQPETLKTNWHLGNVGRDGHYYKTENIEFWPADVTVIAAESSHGKTMFLFQSVFDLLRKDRDSVFLYVSCEENKRQLLERALNVYIDIPTTPDGYREHDRQGRPIPQGGYCFKTKTRRKTIKAVIRESTPPIEYGGPDLATSAEGAKHYDDLAYQIRHALRTYETDIRPRLKLIHTEGTVESIAANVSYYVEQFRAEGLNVGGVFVDYMQLLSSDGKNYSRHDEIKDICGVLHNVASETELPVIVAAQMNREGLKGGIDSITLANLGEGADIERIAHDVYFVWQINKTKRDMYFKFVQKGQNEAEQVWNPNAAGDRANRIFYKPKDTNLTKRELKNGYLYVEQMKARDGETGGWGLFPYDGERGRIGENDTEAMAK